MSTDTTPTPIGALAPRYKIGYRTDEWGERSSTPGGIPDPAGAWVRYDDHVAALAGAAQPVAFDSTHDLVEQCRRALAEELSAWDIDPPLHHVKEAHDACVTWLAAAPNAVPAQCPTSVDAKTMELAESVGLIGPASRTHDLHAAIQRFHDLVCVNATIKAAQMASDAIREVAPAAQGDALDSDRLNWLEANAQITIERLRRIGSEKRVYEVASNDDEIYGEGDTLRAAIDAARAAQKGGA